MDERKRLKNIWYGMKRRCLNPAPSDFFNGIAACYYEKGITICDDWKNDFDSFCEWALKNGYTNDLTIDRIDPDMGYSPGNCRWISLYENLKRARKNTGYDTSKIKSKNYFLAHHYCGSTWAIVKETRLCYSDAIRKRQDMDKRSGWVTVVLRHGKNYLGIEPGDAIDFPAQNGR